MSSPHQSSMEPYRPPADSNPKRGKNSLWEPLTAAYFLWSLLAVLVVASGYFLRPVFEEFELELPLLTRMLVHPMASVFFGATALMVILSGLAMDSPAKRNRLGRIAISLALIVFLACLFSLVHTIWSATSSLT